MSVFCKNRTNVCVLFGCAKSCVYEFGRACERARMCDRESDYERDRMRICDRGRACERGQSTIEAAFVAPILLGCILMLVQPCIVLYDRIVMQSAASEACRLASTLNSSTATDLVDGLVHRRLAAIPQQDNFHVHGNGCSYEVEVKGNETSSKVSVKVSNKLKPLPLIDFMCKSIGATDSDGCWSVNVEASAPTQPDWVENSPSGRKPSGWVGDWL